MDTGLASPSPGLSPAAAVPGRLCAPRCAADRMTVLRPAEPRPPMNDTEDSLQVRPLDELDIDAITDIDEKIGGRYRPEVWETRIGYYLRRDPDSSVVAETH